MSKFATDNINNRSVKHDTDPNNTGKTGCIYTYT